MKISVDHCTYVATILRNRCTLKNSSVSHLVFSRNSNSLLMFLAGRFVIGMNNGLNSGLVPMYLTEIAPFQIRGGVGERLEL